MTSDPRAALARIGDRERESATAFLNEHYVAGRLDTDEHAERLDAIWSARTRADLDIVFWDLPAAAVPPPTAVRRTSRGRPPVAMLLVAVLVLALALQVPWWGWMLAVLLLVTRRRGHGHRRHHAHPDLRPGIRTRTR